MVANDKEGFVQLKSDITQRQGIEPSHAGALPQSGQCLACMLPSQALLSLRILGRTCGRVTMEWRAMLVR
ncbi:MAG TPA: hypothetical protein DDZ84_13425 [Firmicutes bacterium]|jgi:hypothetical protein|nr:hypothetical protein [Bacillota bacterium]